MHYLFTSKYFLILTALFLILSVSIIWFFFPPVLKTFNDNRSTTRTLAERTKTTRDEVATAKELIAAKTTIDTLYAQASAALPDSPSADLLLLELDGLNKDLGLNATITVPFSEGAVSQVTASAAPAKEGEIKAGSGSTGGTKPVVVSSGIGTTTDFSLSGDWDYPTTLNLLTKLKTFSRWNVITNIDLTRNADKSTATVSGKVFWMAASNFKFSGTVKDLINQAEILFRGYQSYASAPDVSKEGDFGKSNPFQ